MAKSHHDKGQLFGVARDGTTWYDPALPFHESRPLTRQESDLERMFPSDDRALYQDAELIDYGGAFDGFAVTSDADPGL